jgi:hypothetical protein
MTKSKKIASPYQIWDGRDYCGSIVKTEDGFQLLDCDGNYVDTFATFDEALMDAGGTRSEFDFYGD